MKTVHATRLASATIALSLLGLAIAPDVSAQAATGKPGAYHIVARYVIGGEGGWDYLRVDTTAHRLFVTRNNRVSTVDLATGKVLAELPGLNKGHGAAWSEATQRGFATSGGDSSVVTFDLATLKELGRTTTADDTDAILYDASSNHVFAMNGDAHSISVIDPASGKRVGANIPLGGLPEFAVVDGAGKLWVNIESTNEIVELDTRALKVLRRWSIKPCSEPSGLAIDVAHSRLFSVCGGSRTMVISDAVKGAVVGSVPIGAGTDGAAFDPSTGNAFSSNGDGTITVVHEAAPNHWKVVQTIRTMTGARTIALDPVTHRLYTVGARFGPTPKAANALATWQCRTSS